MSPPPAPSHPGLLVRLDGVVLRVDTGSGPGGAGVRLPADPRLRTPGIAAAHLRVARRWPRRWIRQALGARDPGSWTRFVLGGLVAERALAPGVGHLHAPFATPAAAVAREAAALTGLDYTVTAPARRRRR